MNYADHIENLLAEHKITSEDHSTGGRAWKSRRHVKFKPVKSAISYAIALHEIGHIVGPRQNSYKLDRETGAWEWAKENALAWTPTMEKKMSKCLCSYHAWSMRRGKARRPPKGHPFYNMAYDSLLNGV